MAETKKRNRWVVAVEIVTFIGGLSGIVWAAWDHVHPKAEPVVHVENGTRARNKASVGGDPRGNGNLVGSTQTIDGDGNLVNNGGTVSIGHTIPQSQMEAARQRLHDSGIEFTRDRYVEALQTHDVETISLFTQAGMTINIGDFGEFTNSLFDEDVAKAMLQIDQSKGCPTAAYMADIYGTLQGSPLAFARQACSNPTVLAQLRKTVDQARGQLRVATENDRENQEHRIKEIASCAATMRQTFGSRVSPATAQEDCTMQIMPTPLNVPKAEQYLSGVEKSLAALQGSH